jgi:BMFP domain-containing protein YqiC
MSARDKKQILDEATDSLAALVAGFLELGQGAGAEAKALLRTRVEKLIGDLDLVDRETFEVAQEQLDKLRAALAVLEARIEALEKKP